MLESKGVIEPVGNGTFVVAELRSPLNRSLALLLSLDEANLSELYELRRMLEGEAAALAAARRSDDDLATMATAIEDMAKGLGDRDTYAAADVRFHVAVDRGDAETASHSTRCTRSATSSSGRSSRSTGSRAAPRARSSSTARSSPRSRPARPRRRADRMRTHLTRVEREIHEAVTSSRLADFSAPPPPSTRRSSAMAQIGYVGLGVMGGGVARRLLEAGHEVTGYNRTRSKAEPLIADGMRVRRDAARGRRAERRRVLDGHEHAGARGGDARGPTGSSPGSGRARSTST